MVRYIVGTVKIYLPKFALLTWSFLSLSNVASRIMNNYEIIDTTHYLVSESASEEWN